MDGDERRVDLGEVNGRVFVNNVSLGVYAEAVQRRGYRAAKLRTLLDTIPDALGPAGTGLDLRWSGPGGQEHSGGAVIMVSNNRYRLGRTVGSGTRPAIDDGLLGVAIAGAPTGRGQLGRSQRPCGNGPRRPSRSALTIPFPRESMARPSASSHRFGSASAPGCCERASLPDIQEPRRQLKFRRARSKA